MKLVLVRKHCAVRYDRRAREYVVSKAGGVTVLVWSKAYRRYVKGDRSILEVACPDCGRRRGGAWAMTCLDCSAPLSEANAYRHGGRLERRCKRCSNRLRLVRYHGKAWPKRWSVRCSRCGGLGHNARSHW